MSHQNHHAKKDSSAVHSQRKVDTATLIALAADGSNSIKWRSTLHEYFSANYENIGTFLEDGQYYEREPWSQIKWTEYQAAHHLSDTQIKRAKFNRAEEHVKQLEKDLAAYHNMHATVLQTISDKQKAELSRDSGYESIKQSRMPMELIDLCQSVLVNRVSGLPKEEQDDALLLAFEGISMRGSESIDSYVERAREQYRQLINARVGDAPSESAAIRRVTRGLIKPRYTGFLVSLANSTRSGGDWPGTWSDIVFRATTFVDPAGSEQARRNMFAYSCNFCNKDGHEESNCWKLHPERAPKSMQKKSKASVTATAAAAPSTAPAVAATVVANDHVVGKKGKKDKKKAGRKTGNVSAYATHTSDSVDQLWGFTAYTVHITVAAHTTHAEVRDPRVVSIDTLANHNFVSNRSLLRDIERVSFSVTGSTGAGSGNEMGSIPGFGQAAYLPQAGCNGLAASVVQKYPCSVEPGKHWTVHMSPDLDLVFLWSHEYSSYSLLFDDEIIALIDAAQPSSSLTLMSSTVTEREKQYPKREVMLAREARRMLGMSYYPSEYALARTLTLGAWLNSRVTAKDINFAKDLYGPDEAVLRGKTKDLGPIAPAEVLVPIQMRRDQIAYADAFFWRQETFVLYIVKPLYLLLARHCNKGTRNAQEMAEQMEHLRLTIEARGYQLTKIVTDPEKMLASLVGKVKGLTTVGSGSHVPDAEVEIRVVEERLRCMESSLEVPVARRFVKYMVYGAVSSRNIILRSWQTAISREVFTGVKFDVKRDLRFKFFDYGQATRIPSDKSGEEPRTVAAVYLVSSGNAEGSMYMYDLYTESEFMCDHFVLLPMSDLVVAKLIQLWDRDEPASRKKRRAAWKLAHTIREDGVSTPNIEPDGNISDIAVVPVQRVVPEKVEFTDFDPRRPAPVSNDMDISPTQQSMGGSAVPDQPADDISGQLQPILMPETTLLGESVEESVEESIGLDQDDDFDSTINSVEDLEAPEGEAAMNIEPKTDDSVGARVRARNVAGRRMDALASSRRVDAYTLRAYRTSLRAALKKKDSGGLEAVLAELQQLIDRDVWGYIRTADLSVTQLKKVIKSLVFIKEKVDAKALVKMKARLVAGGNGQDKSVYENISSPTVSMEAVMCIIAIAALQRRKIATVDVTGAFLEVEMPEDDEVLMELDTTVTRILQTIDPTVVPFINSDGKVIVRLKRALYGCVQSARLWFEKLRATLIEFGFESNPYDLCTFNKEVGGKQVTVAFHVDDLLITSESDDSITLLINYLRSKFKGVTEMRGAVHGYLGMRITVRNDCIEVDMSGYIDKIMKDRDSIKKTNNPSGPSLMDESKESVLLNERSQKVFHADVAKALFLAKRVLYQIMPPISVLAGRVGKATAEDQVKLDKVYGYIGSNRNSVLRFKCGGAFELLAYVDASWAVHDDRHGRTGIIIMLAGCCVGAWTFKQKIVTLSSTESELVALSDGVKHVMWYRRWMMSQGIRLGPTVVYQDNSAVMQLMKNERRANQRTRHLDVRLFCPRDLELAGDISLVWCPTEDMIADLMTKPVQGALFQKLVTLLTGGGIA